MDEDSLMAVRESCPFCACETRARVGIVQRRPEVVLLQCAGCKAASVSRFPTDGALAKYYREDFYAKDYSKSHSRAVTFDNTGRFGTYLAGVFCKHVERPDIRILDFGGGDGTLAVRVAERMIRAGVSKVSITVVDYERPLCTVSCNDISISRVDSLEQAPAGSHDLVIASAVLEHVPRPQEVLPALLRQIAPGGIFYARTPNVVAFVKWFSRLGLQWDFLFPAHLFDFGQDFWEQFFQNEASREFELLKSTPSIVETSFRDHFLTTVAAYSLKSPWYLLGTRYKLVGGWEVFARRVAAKSHEM
jgi:SAM-dependent methyltransferase